MTDATPSACPARQHALRPGSDAELRASHCRPRDCPLGVVVFWEARDPSVQACRPSCCRRRRRFLPRWSPTGVRSPLAAQATALEVLFGFVLSAARRHRRGPGHRAFRALRPRALSADRAVPERAEGRAGADLHPVVRLRSRAENPAYRRDRLLPGRDRHAGGLAVG